MTDAHDFEAFVRRHQDMVYATALRLLANPAEAEDVSQNVFLKAFQRFDHLRHSEAAAGWLKAVTRNACLNHLTRSRHRAGEHAGDAAQDLASGSRVRRFGGVPPQCRAGLPWAP